MAVSEGGAGSPVILDPWRSIVGVNFPSVGHTAEFDTVGTVGPPLPATITNFDHYTTEHYSGGASFSGGTGTLPDTDGVAGSWLIGASFSFTNESLDPVTWSISVTIGSHTFTAGPQTVLAGDGGVLSADGTGSDIGPLTCTFSISMGSGVPDTSGEGSFAASISWTG